MKKIILFCVLAIGIQVIAGCNKPQSKPGLSQLQVQGTFLVNEQGDTVVLNGISFGWHNWWPRFYTAETVKWLVDDWHVNVVRAAMGIEPDSGYLNQPQWSRERIITVVDAAIANNVYVIIDWHSHGIYTEEAVAFFGEMAQKYGEYPHVIYEIFNEPDYESWAEVKAYSVAVMEEIRKYDPDNIILVGSTHWCQDLHIVADDPIQGFSNIMYTLHFYAASHKQWLRDRADYALSKGIPIFVSEFGETEATGDGYRDLESWQEWREWMDRNKISWVKWTISDKFESSAVLLPSASSYGNWRQEDLTPSGIMFRDILREIALKRK